MLRWVLFDTAMFAPGDDDARARKDLMWLLEALSQRNQTYLAEHPETPKLYTSGVTYAVPQQMDRYSVPEVAVLKKALGSKINNAEVGEAFENIVDMVSGERFRDIPRVIEAGQVDCFPLTQKIIVRSKSTGCYEILSLGDLRFTFPYYEALSYNFESKQYEFRNIVGFVDKGDKPVYKARLSNGTDLVSTGNHEFWALDGSKQHHAPASFHVERRSMAEYAEVYDKWKRGKYSSGQRTNRSRILQAARIPALNAVDISSDAAYLVGIYAAEGYTRPCGVPTIAQHKPEIRTRIEQAMSSLGIASSYTPGHGATPGSGAEYRLTGKHPMYDVFRSQGRDSFDKHIPPSLLSASREIVEAVMRGHGDGDAWRPENGAYKRPGVKAIYATSSDRLMEQLRLSLLILGKPSYAYRYEKHGGSGKKPIWRLHEWAAAPRLRARESIIDEILPGLTYGTVRNVEEHGTAHVGCIEVEGNHNFFLSDGTLVSNCDNLSAWRVAELRQAGIKAMPYVTHRARLDGGTTMHALVRWPDGTDEDPSRILGMGGDTADALKERAEEIRKNDERRDSTAKKIDDLLGAGLLTKREAKAQLVMLGSILPPLRNRPEILGGKRCRGRK